MTSVIRVSVTLKITGALSVSDTARVTRTVRVFGAVWVTDTADVTDTLGTSRTTCAIGTLRAT